MTVLAEWRGIRIGQALLSAVLKAAAQRGFREVFLHAQLTADAFYLQSGFHPEGHVFEEGGIPHRTLGMTVQ